MAEARRVTRRWPTDQRSFLGIDAAFNQITEDYDYDYDTRNVYMVSEIYSSLWIHLTKIYSFVMRERDREKERERKITAPHVTRFSSPLLSHPKTLPESIDEDRVQTPVTIATPDSHVSRGDSVQFGGGSRDAARVSVTCLFAPLPPPSLSPAVEPRVLLAVPLLHHV